jgi:hypothetical protein
VQPFCHQRAGAASAEKFSAAAFLVTIVTADRCGYIAHLRIQRCDRCNRYGEWMVRTKLDHSVEGVETTIN